MSSIGSMDTSRKNSPCCRLFGNKTLIFLMRVLVATSIFSVLRLAGRYPPEYLPEHELGNSVATRQSQRQRHHQRIVPSDKSTSASTLARTTAATRSTATREHNNAIFDSVGVEETASNADVPVATVTRHIDYDPCEVMPGQGEEGYRGFQGLYRVTKPKPLRDPLKTTSTPNPRATNPSNARTKSSSSTKIKILCVLHNATSVDSIQAAYEVYGHRCDKFLVTATTRTNSSASANPFGDILNTGLDASLVPTILDDGIIQSTTTRAVSAQHQWETLLRLLWHLVTKQDLHTFDFLHISTEQTLVIEANLRAFLSKFVRTIEGHGNNGNSNSHNTTRTHTLPLSERHPLYIGGPALFANDPTRRYCSPGAGFSLNPAAVDIVLKHCWQNTTTSASRNCTACTNSYERLADCLYQNKANDSAVICQNTMDGKSLRYLEYGVRFMASWSNQSPGPIPHDHLNRYHGMHISNYLKGISTSAIGIHMVHGEMPLIDPQMNKIPASNGTGSSMPNLLRRFYAIIDKRCEESWADRSSGAFDEQGKPGYVHDPHYLKRHAPPLNLHPENDNSTCQVPMRQSVEGHLGYEALKKIQVNQDLPPVRLLCIVYTHAGNHKTRIQAIAETYAQRCDGFMAASNQTDARIGAVQLLHEGPETYENMWLKVRAIWTYVHKHFLKDFDYFHIGGDDMYVIPENLKHLVATGSVTGSWNQAHPLYLGSSCADPRRGLRFCGGGAGYTLNQNALQLLVDRLFPTLDCGPHLVSSQEDRLIADCFRSRGILCPNSQDDVGEERYHHMDAEFHARWRKGRANPWGQDRLERQFRYTAKDGMGQISKDSVSFHLKSVKANEFADNGMRRYHAILHGYCNGSFSMTSPRVG